LSQGSQDNLTNRFQVAKPVFSHAASDIYTRFYAISLRKNNKMSSFFYAGERKPNQTEVHAN